MTEYRQCPFCEEYFEVGPEGDDPTERGSTDRRTVTDRTGDDGTGDDGLAERVAGTPTTCSFEAIRVGLRADDAPRGLLLAVLHKRDILTPVLAQWYGVSESSLRSQFDRLDTEVSGSADETSR